MFYKDYVSPVLDNLDSETWHCHAVEALHFMENGPVRRRIIQLLNGKRLEDTRLNMQVGSMTLENPVMVGAGWDKKGRAVRGLRELGFSGVEVGSVLQNEQPGNDKPRQFIIAPGVSLNRLGFNSPGMDVVAKNLKRYEGDLFPIGISLGKNKNVKDKYAPVAHAAVATKLAPFASYFAINVSSPNTPGLRALQEKGPLRDIVQEVQGTLRENGYDKDLYVKIAPDLTLEAVDDVIEVAMEHDMTGIIASNTTISPELKATYGKEGEMGGLSGDNEAYRKMSTKQIGHIYRQTRDQLTIIGVGGVKDAYTALEKIRAGASAVQLVTALRGEGPGVANAINRGIIDMLNVEGIAKLEDVRGASHA